MDNLIHVWNYLLDEMQKSYKEMLKMLSTILIRYRYCAAKESVFTSCIKNFLSNLNTH